jgi:hypothetical protein
MSEDTKIYDKRLLYDQQRFEEQCFLMDHWFYFMPLSENWTNARWNNITLLKGNPYNAIHSLFAIKNLKPLTEITPLEIAAMQPKIRIFKVALCTDEAGKTKKVTKEIVFKDHTRQDTLDGILKTNVSRSDQVGLKSFVYRQIGTTHGAEEKNILCELNLVFKNLKDIFSENRSDETISCIDKKPNFSDLIIYPPAQTAVLVPGDDPFEIKVQVGFADPQVALKNMDIGSSRKDELIRIIRMMNDTLNLTLVEHDFNFRQDGSAELKIVYQGSFESRMTSRSADIFQPSGLDIVAKRDKLEKEIRVIIKNTNRIESEATTDGGSKREIKKLGDKLEEKQSQLRQLTNRDLQTKYSKLIDILIGRVGVFPVKVHKNLFGRSEDGGWIPKKRTSYPGGGNNFDPAGGALWALDIIPGIDPGARVKGATEWSEWKKTINATMAAASAEEDQESRKRLYAALKNRRKGNAPSHLNLGGGQSGDEETDASNKNNWYRGYNSETGSHMKFNFFYFGDLISAAARCMGFDGTELSLRRFPDFRILVGNILFNDPVTGIEVEDGVNLAHIPISLNLFRAWFVENVIKKQIRTYTLQKFIRDAIRGLILPALGTGCRVNQSAPAGSRPMSQHIPAPKRRSGTNYVDRIPPGNVMNGTAITQEPAGGRFEIGDIIDRDILSTRSHDAAKDTMNYLYISSIGSSKLNRRGDRKKDTASGIYHFNIGSPRGLLKKAEFSRVELENLVELRSEEAAASGNGELQIQRVYDCDITLVGNCLFKPGMMVFVNPTMAGGGNPMMRNSISRKLGIGGYYFVLEVENIIEAGVYETLLKTKFLGLGNYNTRNESSLDAAAAAMKSRELGKVLKIKSAKAASATTGILVEQIAEEKRDDSVNRALTEVPTTGTTFEF